MEVSRHGLSWNDYVEVSIPSSDGKLYTRHLDWQQVLDPASVLNRFPLLSAPDVSRFGRKVRLYNSADFNLEPTFP